MIFPVSAMPRLNPGNCRITVTARVGPVGDDAGDDFMLRFVTPRWLAGHPGAGSPPYSVLVPRVSWDVIEHRVADMVSGIDAADWEQFVERFSEMALWEFSPDELPD